MIDLRLICSLWFKFWILEVAHTEKGQAKWTCAYKVAPLFFRAVMMSNFALWSKATHSEAAVDWELSTTQQQLAVSICNLERRLPLYPEHGQIWRPLWYLKRELARRQYRATSDNKPVQGCIAIDSWTQSHPQLSVVTRSQLSIIVELQPWTAKSNLEQTSNLELWVHTQTRDPDINCDADWNSKLRSTLFEGWIATLYSEFQKCRV